MNKFGRMTQLDKNAREYKRDDRASECDSTQETNQTHSMGGIVSKYNQNIHYIYFLLLLKLS